MRCAEGGTACPNTRDEASHEKGEEPCGPWRRVTGERRASSVRPRRGHVFGHFSSNTWERELIRWSDRDPECVIASRSADVYRDAGATKPAPLAVRDRWSPRDGDLGDDSWCDDDSGPTAGRFRGERE